MPKSRAPLVHVGYIKTGTTYLQQNVWSLPNNGFALAGDVLGRAHMVSAVLHSDTYDFDATRLRTELDEVAAPIVAAGQVPVWSEEMILGNPPREAYEARAKAQRVHQIFPDAKILITIRNQPEMILSMYGEYLLGGGYLPFDRFIGASAQPLGYLPILRADFLQYDKAIKFYQGLFGADQVLVLPLEMLRQNKDAYLARLAGFCNLTEQITAKSERAHVGQGKATYELRRRLNRFAYYDNTQPSNHRRLSVRLIDRVTRNADRLFSGREKAAAYQFKARIAAHYGGQFAESNRRLGALTGLDLAALGYET